MNSTYPAIQNTTIHAKDKVEAEKRFVNNLPARKILDRCFKFFCLSAVILCLGILFTLLFSVFLKGVNWLDWQFLSSFSSRFPEKSGILAGIYGSAYLIVLTMIFSVPTGVGAALYLTELMPKSRVKKLILNNISNLAGVPSIIFGILGLAIFVRIMGFDRSILSGALTLSLVILPIIIIASNEALKAVPESIRLAAMAMGATRWQTVRDHILPNCWAQILTGVILAISRAFGETAPLIIIGALSYVAFTPENVMDYFTTIPIQIYNWTSKPQAEFHQLAAAGIIVLMIILLTANSVAIILRNSFQRKIR